MKYGNTIKLKNSVSDSGKEEYCDEDYEEIEEIFDIDSCENKRSCKYCRCRRCLCNFDFFSCIITLLSFSYSPLFTYNIDGRYLLGKFKEVTTFLLLFYYQVPHLFSHFYIVFMCYNLSIIIINLRYFSWVKKRNEATKITSIGSTLYSTSSPGKLRFASKCILNEWLYNVTKGIGRVHNVSESSIGSWKVCGNDYLRQSVQSGHMVAEGGVKPLSAIICLMKWGSLQLPILSPNILQY